MAAVGNVDIGNLTTPDKAVYVMLQQWNAFLDACIAANGTGNTLAAAVLTGGSNPLSKITFSPNVPPSIPNLP